MVLFPSTVSVLYANALIVIEMDQVGWHIANALQVPAGMGLVLLAP